MEKTSKKNFAKFLTPEEQTKALENVIDKGLFDQIVPLAADGYTFNLLIFELLRTCKKHDILEQIWNMDFQFFGPCKQLTSYVEKSKGMAEAARFIQERRATCSIWNSCYIYFSDEMLEVVQDWDALVARGNFDLLLKNERYDNIIRGYERFSSSNCAKAIQILKEKNLGSRVLELKQYKLLTMQDWQPEGAQLLIAAGKGDYLIRCWHYYEDLPEELHSLCETEEGRELLCRKNKRKWLYDAGYPQYMVQNQEWVQLARLDRFDLVDWKQANECEKGTLINIAVRHRQWDFLLKNRQYRVLLKHRKFKLLIKFLLKSKN